MLKNLRIRTRLLLGFALLLILLIAVSFFSINRMNYLSDFTTGLYQHPFQVNNAQLSAEVSLIKIQRLMREMLLFDTVVLQKSGKLQQIIDEIDVHEKDALNHLETVKRLILMTDKTKIDKLIESVKAWKPVRDEQIELAKQNKRNEAIEITMNKALPYVNKLSKEIEDMKEFTRDKADKFFRNAQKSKASAYLVVGIVDLFAIILSILVAFWLTKSINRPVSIAAGVADRMASGDISVEIPQYSKDELGMMLESMRNMAMNLKNQMRQLSEGIVILSGSAAQISTATAQFAATTQEVSTSVNEVVVSMKEVKQTTALSTEKAKEMSERAMSVVEISRSGESAVRETIDMINMIQEQMLSIADSVVGLSDQSQSIGEIIAAVDDVADQSRLLAVNASIEAVKAGEQGKGFTVVADEIKTLAVQSKQSTSQVRTILMDIQKATSAAVMATEKGSKAVENSVKQAGQTGNAIQTLGSSIDQASLSAVQIEATSRQQSAGIEQVFSAMESISSAIAQNAQSARQLEDSARNLDELGRKLKTIVERYKI